MGIMDKKPNGRTPLIEGERTINTAIKCPRGFVVDVDAKVVELKKKGYKTNRSHFIRAMVNNSMPVAEHIIKNNRGV